MTIQEKWKQLRKKKNLTINDVSKISGISRSTISRFENGHNDISTTMLERLCNSISIKIKFSDDK